MSVNIDIRGGRGEADSTKSMMSVYLSFTGIIIIIIIIIVIIIIIIIIIIRGLVTFEYSAPQRKASLQA